MGAAPLVLAGMLTAGAVVALALSLAASARRRSRDLALLKTLGFARRQVVAVVIWQASVPVAIGTVAGIPLGIATGRFLWARFASELYVVPQPATSMVMVTVAAMSALALAILTAIVPGWLSSPDVCCRRAPRGVSRTVPPARYAPAERRQRAARRSR